MENEKQTENFVDPISPKTEEETISEENKSTNG